MGKTATDSTVSVRLRRITRRFSKACTALNAARDELNELRGEGVRLPDVEYQANRSHRLVARAMAETHAAASSLERGAEGGGA